jgi:mRNA-degrading endonuclease RelE of RelBE toxin-antitoxin system
LPLEIRFTATARKYFDSLDKPTRQRIAEKLRSIAQNPHDARLSKPLIGTDKRSARIGQFRILFLIDERYLTVVDIGPRGQIYRNL